MKYAIPVWEGTFRVKASGKFVPNVHSVHIVEAFTEQEATRLLWQQFESENKLVGASQFYNLQVRETE